MSANIPLEIQEEIIRRVVNVKSLIRFTSVSKQWKSLITSSKFIDDHSVNQTQPQHLLVSYNTLSECKYVSFVDDDSFPGHKFSHIVPPSVKLYLSYTKMIDSSHGLVCLYASPQFPVIRNHLIIVWNPSVRKYAGILLPPPASIGSIGFGVCPKTGNPKIVKISCEENPSDDKAEVFTLSYGVWESKSMNLPHKSIDLTFNQVVIDGVVYWLAYDDDLSRCIISFDLTSEEFGEVDMSHSLHLGDISISKLKNSLVVLDYDEASLSCDVWMMIQSDYQKSSFEKLFTFDYKTLDGLVYYEIIGFRKNGHVIRERICITNGPSIITLEAYDPYTKQSEDLGFETTDWLFKMTSYKESLLLLNNFDSIVPYDSIMHL